MECCLCVLCVLCAGVCLFVVCFAVRYHCYHNLMVDINCIQQRFSVSNLEGKKQAPNDYCAGSARRQLSPSRGSEDTLWNTQGAVNYSRHAARAAAWPPLVRSRFERKRGRMRC